MSTAAKSGGMHPYNVETVRIRSIPDAKPPAREHHPASISSRRRLPRMADAIDPMQAESSTRNGQSSMNERAVRLEKIDCVVRQLARAERITKRPAKPTPKTPGEKRLAAVV